MPITTIQGAAAMSVYQIPAGSLVTGVTVDGSAVAFTVNPSGKINTSGAPVNTNSIVQITTSGVPLPAMHGGNTNRNTPSVSNTFMLVGDSISNHNFSETYDGTDYYVKNMSRFLHIVDGLLDGRLNIVNNGGVSGQRTDEMLARWDNNVKGVGFYSGLGGAGGNQGTVLPGVSPFSPQLIGIVAGVNDMLQGKGRSATLAGIISLWKRAQQDGVKKVFGATVPVFAGADKEIIELNKDIRAAARDFDVAIAFDLYGAMVDRTAASIQNLAGYTQDQATARLHPNNRAAWAIAIPAAEIIRPFTTSQSPLPTSAWDYIGNNTSSKQIMSNPMLLGSVAASGTNNTGVWATGGTTSGTTNGATTRAFSKVVRADGSGEIQKILVVTTGAEGNADWQAENLISRHVPGNSYQAICRMTLTRGDGSPLDGTENCQGAELRVRVAFAGGVDYWVTGMSVDTSVNLTNGTEVGRKELVVKTPVFTPLASLGAPTLFRAAVNVVTSGATGAGGVLVGISELAVNIV